MNFLTWSAKPLVQSILAICLGSFGGLPSAQAVQLADGTVYFVYPPRMLQFRATHKKTGVESTYYLTLDVPANAGEPLQRVTITQHEGSDNIKFTLQKTQAVATQPATPSIPIERVTAEQKTRTVSVTFPTPVSPGRTVTIALRSTHNPLAQGIYLFGVTAFPPGEKVHGQFLGFGRLHFYK